MVHIYIIIETKYVYEEDTCEKHLNIFVSLAGKVPSSSHKARFFIILLSISATYVITDMYSANLTSLLARPGRGMSISMDNF